MTVWGCHQSKEDREKITWTTTSREVHFCGLLNDSRRPLLSLLFLLCWQRGDKENWRFFRSTTCQQAFPEVCTRSNYLETRQMRSHHRKALEKAQAFLDSVKHTERHIGVSLDRAVAKEMERNYQRIHADVVKIGDVQLEGRRGRPPTHTSAACDHFCQTVYLPFIDFVLWYLQERFLSCSKSNIMDSQRPLKMFSKYLKVNNFHIMFCFLKMFLFFLIWQFNNLFNYFYQDPLF